MAESRRELLLRLRHRRSRWRSRWFRRSWLGGRRSGATRRILDGVRLVIETNDVLRHIDLIRCVQDRRILAGGVQNHAEAVLSRIAVQNVYHFASDAFQYFLLRGARVFLKVVAPAIEPLREPLALASQPRFFLLAQLSLTGL